MKSILISLGGNETLLILLGVAFFAVVMWAIIDILRNNNLKGLEKVIWITVIMVLPVLGTLLYLYFGRTVNASRR
ncbi:PLDc N-terminal domain-containing protein [Dyadobacter psychrotolerans]|uniref:Cardiolipin synthase N-terminal domain-containing protein n=1 Tax=Dyadobacter psychrotolerans TaxID=2541721 RepID=A0A4R5DHS7_9BACT|nr:PLDc N-terminal domain-containing protein [Dyadobacter psychrotolerans]TDE12827.1 hypothetical protein E0F88_21000 [Dyadobacter psychrotolerans]